VAHHDWIHFVVFGPCKIFCFLKQVPAKFFVSENSPWRDYFKKQKILQGLFSETKNFAGTKNKFFFYRDQNLNEPYLQGRVQYLSHLLIITAPVLGLKETISVPSEIIYSRDYILLCMFV